MSAVSAQGRFATEHGSKYLQQLCKHWSHNLAVEFDAQQGRITFPRDARGSNWAGDAVVTFNAEPGALLTRIDASEAGQLEGLKGAVDRHLERFAFREVPVAIEWA